MSNLTIGARNPDGVHANLHEECRDNATFDQRTAYDILWHCATHANIVFEWNLARTMMQRVRSFESEYGIPNEGLSEGSNGMVQSLSQRMMEDCQTAPWLGGDVSVSSEEEEVESRHHQPDHSMGPPSHGRGWKKFHLETFIGKENAASLGGVFKSAIIHLGSFKGLRYGVRNQPNMNHNNFYRLQRIIDLATICYCVEWERYVYSCNDRFPTLDKKAEEMREHLDMLPCFFGPGDGDRVLKGLRNAAGAVLNDKAWRDSIPLREHLQRVQMLANRRCNSASENSAMDCFWECKAILQCLIAVFDEDPDQAISVMQLRDHTEYFFLLMVVANSEGFAAHRKEIVDIIEKYAKKLFEEVDATDGVPVMDTKFNEKDWSTAFLPNNGN